MALRLAGACAVAMVAACAFDPSGLPTSGTDGATGGPDGSGPTVDAPPGTIDGPTACLDDDNDTVCNGADHCPGSDDRRDADSDGTPDGCDDWDCGPTRPSISLPASTGGSVNGTIELWSFNFGPNVVELSPGATIGFGDTLSIRDTNDDCPGCLDQIEVGFADGARFQCVDFGNPSQDIPQRMIRTGTVTAPTAPGRHDVVMQVAQANNCNSGSRVMGWWQQPPTSAPLVAAVCVR